MKTAIRLPALLLIFANPAAFAADINLNVSSTNKSGTTAPLKLPTILVTGASNNKYDEVTSNKLVVQLHARVTRGDKFNLKVAKFTPGWFTADFYGGDSKSLKDVALEPWFDESQSESLNGDWRLIEWEFEYQDPTVDKQNGVARSPVVLCNNLLKSKFGAAREKMLNHGDDLYLPTAYSWNGKYWFYARPRGRLFEDDYWMYASGHIGAKVHCGRLNGPKPRKTMVTVGVNETGEGRKGKPLSENPPFSTLKLDITPSTATVDLPGGMRCPVSLRLHGTMTAKREFKGRAVLFGTYFLAPPSALSYPKGGTRNLVVTYPIPWTSKAKLSDRAIAVSKVTGKSLSKDLHFQLNVVNRDDKVVGTSGRKEFKVVCDKVPPLRVAPNPKPDSSPFVVAGIVKHKTSQPAPTNEASGDDANEADEAVGDFDASIRKVERIAADRLKIWIYNAGPQPTQSCSWIMTTERDGDSSSSSESIDPIAAGKTIDFEHSLAAPLAEYSAAAIQVECDGESVGHSANNLHVLVK